MRHRRSRSPLPEVRLDGVRFAYPGGVEVYPEPGLTLALGDGVTALVGENGAGKTTLTKLLIGLLRPNQGSVTVAGVDVASATVAEMARIVGYSFQNPDDQLFERTVKAEVSFGPRVLGKPAEDVERGVAWALKACGLQGKEEVHPHDLGLSERKWVAIASALAGEPKVVVLDEPTLGQDYPSRERLRMLAAQLADLGRAVLVVTHDMDFVGESCPTTVVLSHGVVRYAGATEKAFADRSMVDDAGIQPPHVTALARSLGMSESVSEAAFLAAIRW
ncbi:MAG: ABC transporter ATP-binding protein [Chloroflexi bacterium]|nr:MAG: ABC transporter ATP-binding protein [Chloroflexota bacterium]